MQKERKVAEGLGRIKESYDQIQSAYGQDKLRSTSPARSDAKVPKYKKDNYDHIKSSYAQDE